MKIELTDFEAKVLTYALRELGESTVDKIINEFEVEEGMSNDPFDAIDSFLGKIE